MSKTGRKKKPYQIAFENSTSSQKTVSVSASSELHDAAKKLAKELNCPISEIYTRGAKAFIDTVNNVRDEVKVGKEATHDEEVRLNLFFPE